MTRVTVKPELFRWARERAGFKIEDLQPRFPKLALWERDQAKPTLKQLEGFAKATFVPIGYLFLQKPPKEQVPIPDLRTIGNREIEHPSPNLLDTIYICQRRQSWYRDFAKSSAGESHRFVGSAQIDAPIEETAKKMRRELGFDLETQRRCPTWTEALRIFIEQAEKVGVLVMCSGVVLNNNHRTLDPGEFRGFALADDLAPLVFINGADTRAAQMFTLAHELAHLWLGESALSDVGPASSPVNRIERWCNRVAAEFLVPLDILRDELGHGDPLPEKERLARRFKVSTLVILRRIFDAHRITREVFQQAYDNELKRLLALPKGSGGDFYLTEAVRVSRRFARALIESTLEGQTLFRDAFQMLGIRKEETFSELARSLRFSV
jgi:Zn-dependent peptidase ImmA (M78 family)